MAPGPLFAGLDAQALARIEAAAAALDFAAGEALFRQGEGADRVLVIVQGVVRIWRASPNGASLTVRLMRAGETPGFIAAYRRVPYPANATAEDAGRLLVWPAGTFTGFIAAQSRLAANALAIVGARTEDMLTRLHEVAALPVEQRVARALLREAQAWSADEPGRGGLPLTRLALAELSAATLHTVSRLVSGWRRDGLVDAGRGRIAILDHEGLEARAGLRRSLRRNK